MKDLRRHLMMPRKRCRKTHRLGIPDEGRIPDVNICRKRDGNRFIEL
jgi:hypothetical protein